MIVTIEGTAPGTAKPRQPTTQSSIVADLVELGLGTGDVVIVHSSLRSLGYVVGGAQAVVGALLEVVGEHGTVVVPTHSGAWSEPSHWEAPAVPEEWWATIREAMPAYHPRLTPTTRMGAVVECMRRWPGFVRSWHPRVSFGAIGPQAATILADHTRSAGLGEASPLAHLYALDAKVLLIGVGHENSSVLHLAEHRSTWPGKRWITQGAAVLVDEQPRWVSWRELDDDASDFGEIGEAIDGAGIGSIGTVGEATARLLPVRASVDLAATWIAANRK